MQLLRQLRPALVAVACFTVITGIAYPLVITGVASAAFPDQSAGSPIEIDGVVRASSLVAQPFEGDEWFQPRPSAVDYDATGSGGSNLGPTNPELLDEVTDRVSEYRERNALDDQVLVPVDAVTGSGSGLDPHISERNAELQAPRVAQQRGLALDTVLQLVEEHTDGRSLGFLGEPRVNVVLLNADLARLTG